MRALKLELTPHPDGLGSIAKVVSTDVTFKRMIEDNIFAASQPGGVLNNATARGNYSTFVDMIRKTSLMYSIKPFTLDMPNFSFDQPSYSFKISALVVDDKKVKNVDIIKVARERFTLQFNTNKDVVFTALKQKGDFNEHRDYLRDRGIKVPRSWADLFKMDLLGKLPAEDFINNDVLVGTFAKLNLIKLSELQKYMTYDNIFKLPEAAKKAEWFTFYPFPDHVSHSSADRVKMTCKISDPYVTMVANRGAAVTTPTQFGESLATSSLKGATIINEGTACRVPLDNIEDLGLPVVTIQGDNASKAVVTAPIKPPKLPLFNLQLSRRLLTKYSTVDNIKAIIRLTEEKLGGRKKELVPRLIDSLTILYDDYDAAMGKLLGKRRFLIMGYRNAGYGYNNRTSNYNRYSSNTSAYDGTSIPQASRSLTADLKLPSVKDLGIRQLDDTMFIMYIIRHLRGSAILDPCHTQDSYSGSELANYIVMVADGYSSIPLLKGLYSNHGGTFTIDMMELLDS